MPQIPEVYGEAPGNAEKEAEADDQGKEKRNATSLRTSRPSGGATAPFRTCPSPQSSRTLVGPCHPTERETSKFTRYKGTRRQGRCC